MFVLVSEPAQKYENIAIVKQNYTLKLLIAVKMVCSCCFSSCKNLDFLQKKFYNINCWSYYMIKMSLCLANLARRT